MLPSSVTPPTEPVIWRRFANITRIAYLLNSRQEADENDLVPGPGPSVPNTCRTR
jgi:hypothetical protein